MIFKIDDENGVPYFKPERLDQMWPLLDLNADLLGDARVLYKALSSASGDLRDRTEEEVAQELGWPSNRVSSALQELLVVVRRS
jgi:hypothetical protein